LHGQFTPYAVRSVIKHFSDEIMEHIEGRRCRAGVCRGLIRHRISDPQAAELDEAAQLCPTAAIVEQEGGRAIDEAACIQCGLCLEVAPQAVVLEPRFAAPPGTGNDDRSVGVEPAAAAVAANVAANVAGA
jgi:Fe-S-cluster-containing hydrogenase component 2